MTGVPKKIRAKGLILTATLATAVMLQACAINKSVHTELVIPAAPEEIWPVLTDAAGYSAWNPVLVRAEGTFMKDAEITYLYRDPDGKESEIVSTVTKFLPNRELSQHGGMTGIITFDHTYLLEAVEGGTRVTQKESYFGVWVPFWDADAMEPAYARANEALKARVLALKESG